MSEIKSFSDKWKPRGLDPAGLQNMQKDAKGSFRIDGGMILDGNTNPQKEKKIQGKANKWVV